MSSVTHFVCDNFQSFLSYVAGVDDASIKGAENNEDSRTELDLHANMPVIGKKLIHDFQNGNDCVSPTLQARL